MSQARRWSVLLRQYADAGRRAVRRAVHEPAPYLLAALIVATVTAAMLTVRDELGVLNVALVFLLLAFALALGFGAGPAALAAVLSFLVFDFFFLPPFHTFTVADGDHVLALFIYLGIAIVTGHLVARVRARTELAVREQRRTELLYELNAALVGNTTLDSVLAGIVEQVVTVYGAHQCRILLPDDDGRLAVRARFPADAGSAIDRQRLAVAGWVLEHREAASQGIARAKVRLPHGSRPMPTVSARRSEVDVLYVPIATADRAVGVLEIAGRPGTGRFEAEDEQLLTSFANQAALALERARLTEAAGRAAILAQSDELKSALLAAVSHDLRTPLAAIKASATSLLDRSVEWDDSAQTEFLQAIDEETDRLTLMVGNLLDLSRIEGGALHPDKEWYDVVELIAHVVTRLSSRAAQHDLRADVEQDLPLVLLDFVEIAQVLVNLVENALIYTPPSTAITLSARRSGGDIEFAVVDQGPGIPASHVPRLFDKFYQAGDVARVGGSGIGLAICKGLVEAHGGRIWVESCVGEGAAFRFTIPIGDTEGAPA